MWKICCEFLDDTLEVRRKRVSGITVREDLGSQGPSILGELVELDVEQVLQLHRGRVNAGLQGPLGKAAVRAEHVDLVPSLESAIRQPNDIQAL
jgi:hypothetical protein